MKNTKTAKTFAFIIILSLLSILACEFFPIYPFNLSQSKIRWIKEKIYAPRETVDFAIIGSSYVWCDIKANLISQFQRNAKVWNLGRNYDGREIDFITAKHLLQHHNVKNMILQFYDHEILRGHRYTPFMISPSDAVAETAYYIKNILHLPPDLIKPRINAIVSYLGNLSIRTYFQLLRKEKPLHPKTKRRHDKVNGFYYHDDRLTQNKKDLAEFRGLSWDIRPGDATAFPIPSRSAFYLDKIHKLCLKHKVKLYFVFIPHLFQYLPSQCTFDYYNKMGDVLIPNIEPFRNLKYWRDRGHLFQEGSKVFTKKLIRLLRKGKEASPYYKHYVK
ncbi:MAG: hypothetical protein GY757_28300 [bacterium]|nr:hypothetical protein [bacterium]